jgi:hypothetical protein
MQDLNLIFKAFEAAWWMQNADSDIDRSASMLKKAFQLYLMRPGVMHEIRYGNHVNSGDEERSQADIAEASGQDSEPERCLHFESSKTKSSYH